MESAEGLRLVTEGMLAAVGEDCGLGAVVKFDFGADGVVVIDATVIPNEVTNIDKPAACTLQQSMEDFELMNDGKLDSTQAFMSGRLKVLGDMGLALRIDGALHKKG